MKLGYPPCSSFHRIVNHATNGRWPVVSHELADVGAVLLFHRGVVILMARTGTGEGDLLSTTEAGEPSPRQEVVCQPSA
jgi:hypothetical protein